MISIKTISVLCLSILLTFCCGCPTQPKSCLLVIDGINVSKTPGLLLELEAMSVNTILALSIHDLRAFSTVRLIAREAAMRGHYLALSGGADTFASEADLKSEWFEYVRVPLEYTTNAASATTLALIRIEFSLDLSPDFITNVPQYVRERIQETPTLGRILYINSFQANSVEKVVDAVKTYQNYGFQFVKLKQCL